MKQTKVYTDIYPWNKGLDKTSIPGTQDPKALNDCKNVVLNTRGSIRKKPGVERVEYIGTEEGNLQGVVHFFATSGSGQKDEIIRVIGGKMQARRNGQMEDLGISVSDTDSVTFDRFANALLTFFENSRPQKYLIGGTPSNLGLLSGHEDSPPSFSTVHDFRLWYGGRPADPHTVFYSAINSLENYSLASGGGSIRINDGDGDPRGVIGLSRAFRGDIYAFKFNGVYRITGNPYGYQLQTVTDSVGCVHHNTIVSTPNDVYFVSSNAVHSLINTERYGDVEEYTLSFPIYDFFQNDVNWSAAKTMSAIYDKETNCYLLSYPGAGSATPNKVLGINVFSKQWFIWEDVQYHSFSKYWDFNRQRVLVGDDINGLGVLKSEIASEFGKGIDMEVETGIIFPLRNPKIVCSFTQAWLLCRPVKTTTSIDFSFYIDSDLIDTIVVDLNQEGVKFEDVAAGKIGSAKIGTDKIGKNKDDFKIIPIKIDGSGVSIKFRIEHSPPLNDTEQPLEFYGIMFEYNYDEDQEVTTTI